MKDIPSIPELLTRLIRNRVIALLLENLLPIGAGWGGVGGAPAVKMNDPRDSRDFQFCSVHLPLASARSGVI